MTRRRTRQGTAILTAIQAAGRPLAPQEILDAAGQHVDSLSQATVYRQIRRLIDDGTIREVVLPGMPARYELDPAGVSAGSDGEAEAATSPTTGTPSAGDRHGRTGGGGSTAPSAENLAHTHDHSGHHHFFHCETCDAVFPVEGCSGDVERLAPPNFTVRRHEVVLYGRCDECGDDRPGEAADHD
ncbi:MAG: Fur family transcriptional regulator [Phycisphaerales bacterium]